MTEWRCFPFSSFQACQRPNLFTYCNYNVSLGMAYIEKACKWDFGKNRAVRIACALVLYIERYIGLFCCFFLSSLEFFSLKATGSFIWEVGHCFIRGLSPKGRALDNSRLECSIKNRAKKKNTLWPTGFATFSSLCCYRHLIYSV